jgi:hypothetical protein
MVYGTSMPIVRRSFRCWINDDLSLSWIDEGKGKNCHLVIESVLKFQDVSGTWADGVFMGGCADVPFSFLKLSTCSSRFMSLTTSHLMLLISF